MKITIETDDDRIIKIGGVCPEGHQLKISKGPDGKVFAKLKVCFDQFDPIELFPPRPKTEIDNEER